MLILAGICDLDNDGQQTNDIINARISAQSELTKKAEQGVCQMSKEEETPRSSAYKHSQDSVQRPDVGVEAQFSSKKAPKTYRYDSSLAPELSWDENAERPFAEWLLNLVAK